MKKVFLLILIFASLRGLTQTPTSWTKLYSRIMYVGVGADSNLFVPRYAAAPTVRNGHYAAGQLAVDTINHKFYFYSGTSWREVALVGGSTQTLQQVFNQEVGGANLTKSDTINLLHDVRLHIGTKSRGSLEFKDDSTGTNPRSIKMSTDPYDHAMIINATNNINAPSVLPVEQLIIHNPQTTGTSAQAMIGFKVWDGQYDTTIGWIGVSSNSYVTTGFPPKMSYMENDSAGVSLLANNTNGAVRLQVGPFYDPGSVKVLVKNDSVNTYTNTVTHISGNGYVMSQLGETVGQTFTFHDAGHKGLYLTKLYEDATASQSFLPLEFRVPTTGLTGQFLAADNNYSSASVNLPANGIGLLSTADDLSLIAGTSGKGIRFTAGGYAPANEIMRIKSTGVGIGTTTVDASLRVNGTLKFVTGNQGSGKVLQSDANGVADWADATNIGSSDLTLSANRTLTLNSKTLSFKQSTNKFFFIDPTFRLIQFGDINGAGNTTYVEVDDLSQTFKIYSGINELFTVDGNNQSTTIANKAIFTGRLETSKGLNVSSANDLTLGSLGNVFHITGNTQINAIETADWRAGSEITLIFDSNPLVKNNTTGGGTAALIKLAGGVDFSATSNDVLKLVYDGTNWYEVSRSIN